MDIATDQAIDWLVRLDSGHATAQDQQAFECWLQQSPAHAQAWACVQGRLSRGQAHGVEPVLVQLRQHSGASLGRQALLAPPPTAARRRGLLRGGVAAVLLGTTTAWLIDRQTPLAMLAADLRTGTGERGHHWLPDGSELLLDARSGADIAYSATQRLLRLREGALLVQVARSATPEQAARRPFVVQSAQGLAQALGTRFMVRQAEGRTLVHVLEHSVRLTTLSGLQHDVHQGASAWMEADRITPVVHTRLAPAAWSDGLIEVRNQPLGEVIDALRPYQSGVLRISPEAARLRVFGVFPLDRPAQVLLDLEATHPVHVRRWGPWLTVIDLRNSSG
ncbi:DUF4880 domain-containing protein [Comamonas sp. GB3 AK4-5]|uniref:DUF4880 domain-containing protein n=1 Tax=Comamonas sp. GB3 AK4-5 TaxID=3231487 RepID=UPI00351E298F